MSRDWQIIRAILCDDGTSIDTLESKPPTPDGIRLLAYHSWLIIEAKWAIGQTAFDPYTGLPVSSSIVCLTGDGEDWAMLLADKDLLTRTLAEFESRQIPATSYNLRDALTQHYMDRLHQPPVPAVFGEGSLKPAKPTKRK